VAKAVEMINKMQKKWNYVQNAGYYIIIVLLYVLNVAVRYSYLHMKKVGLNTQTKITTNHH
jgi:hypothetical protein